MTYNHAAWLLARMRDPQTSTTDYLQYEREFQAMERLQRILDNAYREPKLAHATNGS